MIYIFITQTWLIVKQKFILQLLKSLIILYQILKYFWKT